MKIIYLLHALLKKTQECMAADLADPAAIRRSGGSV
jgi:phage-related protein